MGSKEPDWWSEIGCCDNFNTSHEERCSQSWNLWSFRINNKFAFIFFTGTAVSTFVASPYSFYINDNLSTNVGDKIAEFSNF